MRKSYATPKLVVYGSITAHTFTTPGGNVKGCKDNCHTDKFGENSGLDGVGS